MSEIDCIITNYPNSDRFLDVNLFNINTSGEHLNKKSAYGTGSCQYLVFFVDKKTNKEFLPSKTVDNGIYVIETDEGMLPVFHSDIFPIG